MSNKKHIDRVFQESFKDFEATPNDIVWENIEAQLNQKKKKNRIIPIWWRYAGVAALLLLSLTIGNSLFNTTTNSEKNKIVDTEDSSPVKIKNDEHNSNEIENLKNKNTLPLPNNHNKTESVIVKNNKEDNKIEKTLQNNNLNNKLSKTPSSITKTESLQNKSNLGTSLASKNNSILELETEEVNTIVSNQENNGDVNNKGKENIVDVNSKINTNNSKNSNVIANINKETGSLIDNDIEKTELTIEEAIDKNKDIIEEENLNRWSVTPNAAPVYFSSFNDDGSSIDPQFNNNSKTGEINMSYGISTSYAVNKRLSIRSGVNKVNLGYNTNNVVIFQSVGLRSNNSNASSVLQNVDVDTENTLVTESSTIDASSSSETLSIISSENLGSEVSPESFTTSNSSINQNLGYIEVPLEIEYSLLNKKISLNVIGGFSSLFLNDNKIFSETGTGERTFLGEANNINKLSYSANFGIGLNYKVFNKIDFNLEPMFKYQINTFNNTSGDFKPFFVGVYSGFAIKF